MESIIEKTRILSTKPSEISESLVKGLDEWDGNGVLEYVKTTRILLMKCEGMLIDLNTRFVIERQLDQLYASGLYCLNGMVIPMSESDSELAKRMGLMINNSSILPDGLTNLNPRQEDPIWCVPYFIESYRTPIPLWFEITSGIVLYRKNEDSIPRVVGEAENQFSDLTEIERSSPEIDLDPKHRLSSRVLKWTKRMGLNVMHYPIPNLLVLGEGDTKTGVVLTKNDGEWVGFDNLIFKSGKDKVSVRTKDRFTKAQKAFCKKYNIERETED